MVPLPPHPLVITGIVCPVRLPLRVAFASARHRFCAFAGRWGIYRAARLRSARTLKRGVDMGRVLGIGGVFFKAKDPAALRAWYETVLGMEFHAWGGAVFPPDAMAAHPGAATVFSLFEQDTDYFAPSTHPYMWNFAVDDLDGVLARCEAHGVVALKTFPDEGNGRFAHIMDPEGNKIELWEPKPAD